MPKQKPNEQVQQIPLSEIRPFKNHPFKVTDDELMQQTIDSIMQVGVLNPAIIRPAPEGGYEMVAGHRRLHAADLAGLKTIPAIVRNLDDDEAVILMVDSNLQRETISPMERAQAYKMKLEAIRRKAAFSLIKLSPMLDIRTALRTLAHVAEVHAVSVQGECKELLLVMTRQKPEKTACHCVNLGTEDPTFTFTLTEEEEAACTYSDTPGRFLYEPNASVMKCGGFRSLATRYGLRKLHPNSHLYTSDHSCKDFPGRAFAIEDCCGFGKKELKGLLNGLGQANLTVRNFPDTVAGLRKRLKLKEGGNAYLFATTLSDGRHVLLRCRKAEPQ